MPVTRRTKPIGFAARVIGYLDVSFAPVRCRLHLENRVFEDKLSLGKAATRLAAMAIIKACDRKGSARIIAATGVPHFDFLAILTEDPRPDWRKVELFHLDEYLDPVGAHAGIVRGPGVPFQPVV